MALDGPIQPITDPSVEDLDLQPDKVLMMVVIIHGQNSNRGSACLCII